MLKVMSSVWLCIIRPLACSKGAQPMRMSLKAQWGRVRLLLLPKWDFLFGVKPIGEQWAMEYWLQEKGTVHARPFWSHFLKSRTNLARGITYTAFSLHSRSWACRSNCTFHTQTHCICQRLWLALQAADTTEWVRESCFSNHTCKSCE